MTITASVTKKQKEVLSFIDNFISENGFFPTMHQIKNGLSLKAVSTVHQHISHLKKNGFISSSGEIFKAKSPFVLDIPLIGKIAAGQPIEAIESVEDYVVAPGDLLSKGKKEDFYALKVVGQSMVDEGVFDGDIVIIKKQSVAENGQTVVAIIDDNEATLKKIYREKNRFRLEPRNQEMLPFYRKEVEIRGVVMQVIRKIEEEKKTMKKSKRTHGFRTIDLFAGVGGVRLGFEDAGFETVFANDFEPNCKHTYDLNFTTSKLTVEDIRKIGVDDLPDFDFLLGGFPCQAFSIAGYRKGFADENRGNLFFDIARILEVRKPEGFLLENVKNLQSHDGGRTFSIIEQTLKDLGYHVRAKVLNTMEYGNVPQNRERIYIVGFKNKDYYDRFNFPEPVKLTVSISDLLEKEVSEKYYYNGKLLYEKLKDHVKEGSVYQWRRQYVRENKKGVCPTLTANMGMGGHNVPIIKDKKGIRKLTPYECARIQGFPEDYKLPKIADSALYKQFGNSVSVPVLRAIASKMKKAME